ncbi:glutamine--tRNA ligase [Enterobacterales bacterium endosymbiont of Anomoneura mori]|uniref:glutamine--tRNA ligase n=1 Tax=Enterobacterales bacterium endosymbiont of Anomoneura mori TaxID=3132096 RepID=UPI00399CF24D
MKKKYIYKKNFIFNIIKKDLICKKYKTITTRFPPEPNGFLHIGHAKSIFLNLNIAKKYNGKCNLRFDDTNPNSENLKYIKFIIKDIKWLGFKIINNIYYTSDYFNIIYKYAKELIKKNLAYVDELSKNKIHKYRGTLTKPGKISPFRNRSIKENLYMFKKMKYGYFPEGAACLRAKINMSSFNIVMRDPILYRIKYIKHFKTNKTWCIYPTYDFSHCISDSLEKITHSLCTLEFLDNRILYNWILDNITKKFNPCQYEFSRLNLTYYILSKRKLKFLVKNKFVNNWDDPRMPTLSGLKCKGYSSNSIYNFCKNIGITNQESLINIETLEHYVRNDLNKKSLHYMGVIDPLIIIIKNMGKHIEMILMLKNPKNIKEGYRIVPFSKKIYIDKSDYKEKFDKNYKRLILGRKIRLRNSYVIKAKKIIKNICGNIKKIYCIYYYNTLNKKIKINNKSINVIHWVSKKHSIPVTINLYNHLFKVPNPGKYKNIISIINPNSLIIKNSYVEPNLYYLKNYNSFQLERIGYFCLVKTKYKNNLIFNRIIKLKKY